MHNKADFAQSTQITPQQSTHTKQVSHNQEKQNTSNLLLPQKRKIMEGNNQSILDRPNILLQDQEKQKKIAIIHSNIRDINKSENLLQILRQFTVYIPYNRISTKNIEDVNTNVMSQLRSLQLKWLPQFIVPDPTELPTKINELCASIKLLITIITHTNINITEPTRNITKRTLTKRTLINLNKSVESILITIKQYQDANSKIHYVPEQLYQFLSFLHEPLKRIAQLTIVYVSLEKNLLNISDKDNILSKYIKSECYCDISETIATYLSKYAMPLHKYVIQFQVKTMQSQDLKNLQDPQDQVQDTISQNWAQIMLHNDIQFKVKGDMKRNDFNNIQETQIHNQGICQTIIKIYALYTKMPRELLNILTDGNISTNIEQEVIQIKSNPTQPQIKEWPQEAIKQNTVSAIIHSPQTQNPIEHNTIEHNTIPLNSNTVIGQRSAPTSILGQAYDAYMAASCQPKAYMAASCQPKIENHISLNSKPSTLFQKSAALSQIGLQASENNISYTQQNAFHFNSLLPYFQAFEHAFQSIGNKSYKKNRQLQCDKISYRLADVITELQNLSQHPNYLLVFQHQPDTPIYTPESIHELLTLICNPLQKAIRFTIIYAAINQGLPWQNSSPQNTLPSSREIYEYIDTLGNTIHKLFAHQYAITIKYDQIKPTMLALEELNKPIKSSNCAVKIFTEMQNRIIQSYLEAEQMSPNIIEALTTTNTEISLETMVSTQQDMPHTFHQSPDSQRQPIAKQWNTTHMQNTHEGHLPTLPPIKEVIAKSNTQATTSGTPKMHQPQMLPISKNDMERIMLLLIQISNVAPSEPPLLPQFNQRFNQQNISSVNYTLLNHLIARQCQEPKQVEQQPSTNNMKYTFNSNSMWNHREHK